MDTSSAWQDSINSGVIRMLSMMLVRTQLSLNSLMYSRLDRSANITSTLILPIRVFVKVIVVSSFLDIVWESATLLLPEDKCLNSSFSADLRICSSSGAVCIVISIVSGVVLPVV